MSDTAEIMEQAARWREASKGVALATVVNTWGSSPRPAGAKLAVSEEGAFVGSVSGGCVEGAVIEEGLAAISDGKPGYFQQQYWVYGRAGKPCRECGTHISQVRQGQRSSFYCPLCQK